MTMATPAWGQAFSSDTSKMSAQEAANAQAMGLGYRFEHHFRAQGMLEIDGRRRDFRGTGTRIHRQSIRRLDGFFGPCWLSALRSEEHTSELQSLMRTSSPVFRLKTKNNTNTC